MPDDILRDIGPLFLGSRLKRLGERMQAGAARVIAAAGLPVQPAHMPLLAALRRRPMTVGELVAAIGISQPGVTRSIGQLRALGLVRSDPGRDQRERRVALTDAGSAAMARTAHLVAPRIVAAVDALCDGDSAGLLATLARLEDALAATPLDTPVVPGRPRLVLRDFDDTLAGDFHDINAEWIEAMFRLEQTDREVLEHPRARIVDPGGAILFVEAEGLGIVGTCALRKTGERSFELTKMGVRTAARGLNAGAFLLDAAIARATALGADPLYLLTNARCAAAIHLYEKYGFAHDAEIMARYGARYARCDVAMRYARKPGN